jgi:hypothetical protein
MNMESSERKFRIKDGGGGAKTFMLCTIHEKESEFVLHLDVVLAPD